MRTREKTPARCRLLGHDWRFGVEGSEVVWSCTRACGAGGRRAYADEREARRRAALFARKPRPPARFLRLLGGSSERER